MKQTTSDLVKGLKETDTTDRDSLWGLCESLESLLKEKKFIAVEEIIYSISNKSVLQGILTYRPFPLDLFKRLIDHEYKMDTGYWDDTDLFSESKLACASLVFNNLGILDYLLKERKLILSDTEIVSFLSNNMDESAEAKQYLLDNGLIDVNYHNGELLLWAIESVGYGITDDDDDDLKFVKLLIEKGVDLSINDYEPIKRMVGMYSFVSLVKSIFVKCIDERNKEIEINPTYSNLLLLVVEQSATYEDDHCIDVVKYFIDNGADLSMDNYKIVDIILGGNEFTDIIEKMIIDYLKKKK